MPPRLLKDKKNQPTTMVKWHPPGYGAFQAFVASSMYECATPEDHLHAREAGDALRSIAREFKPKLDEVAKMDYSTQEFVDRLTQIDTWEDQEYPEVLLSPACWLWVKKRLEAQKDRGCYASARVRLLKSIEEAQEIPIEASTPKA